MRWTTLYLKLNHRIVANIANIVQLTLIVALLLLLLSICVGDWLNRTITNTNNFLALVLVMLITPNESLNILAGLACITFGLVLWKLNVIGAGDVKLLSVLILGIQDQFVLAVTMIITSSSLIMMVLMWLSDRFLSTTLLNKGIPYGIPISIGGFIGVLATMV